MSLAILPRRLYATEYMVPPSKRLGELPGAAQVYPDTMRIALPSISETILVALVAIIDTQMVSNVGTAAIAAVGITLHPRFLVMAVVIALNIAVTSVVARRRGEGDPIGANRCLRQSIILSGASSILLSGVAYIFREDILWLAGAQPDTIELASEYFAILLMGLPLFCVSLTISAAQRGVGSAKIAMRVNIIGNIVKVIFNILLIEGLLFFPGLGVAGAGVATVIGWGVSFILAVASLFHRDGFLSFFSPGSWSFDRGTLTALFIVFSGSIADNIFIRIGLMIHTRLVSGLGTTMFAANAIAVNMALLSFSVGEGLSIASSALVGQSLGKKRPDLAEMYGKTCQRIALAFCTVIFSLYSFGGGLLFRIFTEDPDIIAAGRQVMVVLSLVTFIQCSQFIFLGLLRGAGDTRYSAVVALICILIVRPIAAWIFIYQLHLGVLGGWFAMALDQSLRFVLTYHRVRSGKWAAINI